MRFAELKGGRVFVLGLETGEVIHEVVESFCKSEKIRAASVSYVGGVLGGSVVVVGPEESSNSEVIPMTLVLTGEYEAHGTGTVFMNEDGLPAIHMHCSFGRGEKSITGCIRKGVKVWYVGEVVIREIIGEGETENIPVRQKDVKTGFEIMTVLP